MSNIFTDTTALTPANYGDSVARISDLSGIATNTRPALQSSSALRPVYGRAPLAGRRNLFGNTTFQSGWVKNDITNLIRGVEDRLGGNNAAEFGASPNQTPRLRLLTVPVRQGVDYRFSMEWKQISGTPDSYQFGLGFTGITGRGVIYVRSDGSIAEDDNGFAVRDGVVDYLEDGWKRLTFTFTPYGDADEALGVWFSSYDSVDYRLRVGRPQVEEGVVRTAFQEVLNPFDVTEADAPSPAYLRFDLTDDKMTHTFPDGFTGDVMLFGRNGSWIEENVTISAGGDLDIGPRAVTGGIPGSLDACGDIVGWLPVGRTMTAEERQYMVDYYKERGAKGLLVPGPELMTNYDFSNGLNGWISDSGNLNEWDVIDGKATLLSATGDFTDNAQESLLQSFILSPDIFCVYKARTNEYLYRRVFGDTRSGSNLTPVRTTIDAQGGIVTEGIGRPIDEYGLADQFGVRFRYGPAGTWIDYVSIRELRPEEEW